MFSNVTTGLAISKVRGEMSLYFGCMSQDGMAGGAGLIRVPINGQAQLYRLSNNNNNNSSRNNNSNSRIYGGSMFITDECATFSEHNKKMVAVLPSQDENSSTTLSPVTLTLAISALWWRFLTILGRS